MALQAPWHAGQVKPIPPPTGAGGTTGQVVADTIPPQFHQAYVAAAAAFAGSHGTAAGAVGATTAEAVAAGGAAGGPAVGVAAVPAKAAFAGYHWQDAAGNWHYYRQVRFFFLSFKSSKLFHSMLFSNPAGPEGEDWFHEQGHHAGCTACAGPH